jgi:two-component system, response regulator PdtaR
MTSRDGSSSCSIVNALFGDSQRPKQQRAVIGRRLICMAPVDAAFTNGHAPLVLVVEDEFFLRYVTAEYLEDCGFSVLQAANADEAVSLLQANRDVGAVFSDIQMPGSMNGLGLAHWITETLPDVKVLLTSGHVLPGAAREWPLLAKPYDMAEVERRLREMTAQN